MLPDELDHGRLAEAALAILSLTRDGNGRVWKGIDWDLMELLYEKGWISDPKGKAKSVFLTEEGQQLASAYLDEHFGRRKPAQKKRAGIGKHQAGHRQDE